MPPKKRSAIPTKKSTHRTQALRERRRQEARQAEENNAAMLPDAVSIHAQFEALKSEKSELEKENVRLVLEEKNIQNMLSTYQESMERTIENRDDTIQNLRILLSKAEEKCRMSERVIADRDRTIDELRNSLAKADDKLSDAFSEIDELTFDFEEASERASRYKSERDNNYKRVERLEYMLDDRELQLAENRGMIRTYQAHHEIFEELRQLIIDAAVVPAPAAAAAPSCGRLENESSSIDFASMPRPAVYGDSDFIFDTPEEEIGDASRGKLKACKEPFLTLSVTSVPPPERDPRHVFQPRQEVSEGDALAQAPPAEEEEVEEESPKHEESIPNGTRTEGWGDLFPKRTPGWKCETCLIINVLEDVKCKACESPRVGTGTATGIGGSAAGGVDGSGRAAVGGAAASDGGTNAAAAPFAFGATSSGATATAAFGGSIGTGGFRFGGAEDRNAATAPEAPLFGAPASTVPTPSVGGFGQNGGSNRFGTNAAPSFGSSVAAPALAAPVFNFGASTAAPVAPVAPVFGIPAPPSQGFTFGSIPVASSVAPFSATMATAPAPGGFSFDSTPAPAGGIVFSFGDTSAQAAMTPGFGGQPTTLAPTAGFDGFGATPGTGGFGVTPGFSVAPGAPPITLATGGFSIGSLGGGRRSEASTGRCQIVKRIQPSASRMDR